MSKLEKVTFNPDGEAPVDFFVLAQHIYTSTMDLIFGDFQEH